MAITEGFAHSGSTVLSVQAKPGTGTTSVVVNDARFIHSNLGPQRLGDIVLTVDGTDVYIIRFTFTEEAIDQRTVQGHTKKYNPETAET